MLILPLQYDNHRGPDAVGQHKLTFTMDESIDNSFNPMQVKKGTQFLVMLIEANTTEYEEFVQETPDQTKERFFKQFHAIIGEIAELQTVTTSEYKDLVRSRLIEAGYIKESTKELTLEQLSTEIIKLKKYKNDLIDRQHKP
jgi:predicted HTH domain antitoxin